MTLACLNSGDPGENRSGNLSGLTTTALFPDGQRPENDA
jgi:hypothetical protein